MNIEPQNVLDYHGNNTIFMVWNLKKDLDVKDAFKRICALVINLNNSADVRFPDCGVSCVMGIGYDAWIRLHLSVPLPKELENFVPVVGLSGPVDVRLTTRRNVGNTSPENDAWSKQ